MRVFFMKILNEWKSKDSKGRHASRCLAMCDCGDVSEYNTYNINRGNTTRCKSCALKSRGESRKTHGCSISFKDVEPEKYATYTIWQAIKRRCRSKSDKRYSDYGGRGIDVCNEWYDSFESFLDCMGVRPSKGHQIDRIDNDGNYEPKNCRWVTRKENSRNKRNNRFIEIDGVTKCVSEWAEISGVKADTALMRLSRGWPNKDAIFGNRHRKRYTTPDGEFKTLKEVQDFYGMSSSGSHNRFKSIAFPEWQIVEV